MYEKFTRYVIRLFDLNVDFSKMNTFISTLITKLFVLENVEKNEKTIHLAVIYLCRIRNAIRFSHKNISWYIFASLLLTDQIIYDVEIDYIHVYEYCENFDRDTHVRLDPKRLYKTVTLIRDKIDLSVSEEDLAAVKSVMGDGN